MLPLINKYVPTRFAYILFVGNIPFPFSKNMILMKNKYSVFVSKNLVSDKTFEY